MATGNCTRIGNYPNVSALQALLGEEGSDRIIVLGLKELRLVDQDFVSFLKRCEAGRIELRNR